MNIQDTGDEYRLSWPDVIVIALSIFFPIGLVTLLLVLNFIAV